MHFRVKSKRDGNDFGPVRPMAQPLVEHYLAVGRRNIRLSIPLT